MEIRPASEADLPGLVAALGQRHFFSDRLGRQRAGSGVLLVAWVDGRPVGDVFLDREPATEPAVRRRLPGVPTLSHLEVLGPFQRRGIGTARHYAELDSDAFQVPADVSARLERRGVGALLLRAAEAWGREQGMGYERRSIVFEKRLG